MIPMRTLSGFVIASSLVLLLISVCVTSSVNAVHVVTKDEDAPNYHRVYHTPALRRALARRRAFDQHLRELYKNVLNRVVGIESDEEAFSHAPFRPLRPAPRDASDLTPEVLAALSNSAANEARERDAFVAAARALHSSFSRYDRAWWPTAAEAAETSGGASTTNASLTSTSASRQRLRDQTIPVFGTSCVGADCPYIREQIGAIATTGIGHYIVIVGTPDPNAAAFFSALQLQFPGRFTHYHRPQRLSCSESWNLIVRTGYSRSLWWSPTWLDGTVRTAAAAAASPGDGGAAAAGDGDNNVVVGGDNTDDSEGEPTTAVAGEGRAVKSASNKGGGALLPPDFVFIANADWWPVGNHLEKFAQWARGRATIPVVRFHHFSSFALPYDAFRRLGLFDEVLYPGLAEDVEFHIRAVASGTRHLALYPEWRTGGVHKHRASAKETWVAHAQGRMARSHYMKIKWNVAVGSMSDYTNARPLATPFGLAALGPLDPLRMWVVDPVHRQCVRTGEGPKMTNGRCYYDPAVLRGIFRRELLTERIPAELSSNTPRASEY